MDDLQRPSMDGEILSIGRGSNKAIASIICGRGRVGKTVVANTMVQFFRKHGANLEVWNSDRQNETHSLNLFHQDASRPATDDPEEKRAWFEGNLDRQGHQRFDVVMDMAGGDPMIRQLAGDVRLVQTMERSGIRAVAWHVLGPEAADLDYLRLSMDGGLFMPKATFLVLNTGLVNLRSVEAAFATVINDKVVKLAIDQGAILVWFPRLICMQALIDQGLSFEDAIRGVTKPGHQSLSMTDEARVEIFWEEQVPKFFGELPPEWLPAMGGLPANAVGV